jgi:hypothetical protein
LPGSTRQSIVKNGPASSGRLESNTVIDATGEFRLSFSHVAASIRQLP